MRHTRGSGYYRHPGHAIVYQQTRYTDVSAPDVGGEYLVLFVEVQDLYQSDAVAHVDRFRGVDDWSTEHQ